MKRKLTITLEDLDRGGVAIQCTGEPPLEGSEPITTAERLADAMLEMANQLSNGAIRRQVKAAMNAPKGVN